jgi:hypothetical protein
MLHLEQLIAGLVPTAVAPSSPEVGQLWQDSRTNEILTWDGTYWRVGDLVRVETLVAIGGAAADHDIGWNVPADFDVVKASMRLLKVLTGAGGAVKAGFGTKVAGDPDKYGLTAALTVGNPDQNVNPTWNDGGGDDLGITGCDAAGAALGTLAGSGADDARVMVWMRPAVTLPA